MSKYELSNDKIRSIVESQFKIWLLDLGDEDKPIQFSDQLAYGMICADFARLIKNAYKLGKIHERRNRSHRMRKKYQTNNKKE